MAKHVLIVGAGVVGLSSAYYCLSRGMRVTVIDRGPAERDGCSFGNAGMIVPSHFVPLAAPGMVALGLKWMWNPESPFYIKPRLSADLWSWCYRFWRSATKAHVERSGPLLRDLHLASRACYETWAASTQNAFGLEKHGLLMLCKTQHTLAEEAKTAEYARRLGVPAEVLDAGQTAALDPNVQMDVAGSVYFPMDCHLAPNRLMAWLLAEVQKLGGAVCWQTECSDWHRRGSRLQAVQTSGGAHAADEFVICGGSWSASMARALNLRLPLQAGKGYSLTLTKPRQLPKVCAILTEARVAVTPIGTGLRFGGTMEIAGLDETINSRRVRGIIRAIPQYYPRFKEDDFADLKPWCGLRPCSPDGLPYLGRTRAWQNLIIATGHAMMGVSLGPITGKIVADILANGRPPMDLSLLSPDRFGSAKPASSRSLD
jgi:D-amino-acid dehydrogenase